jgi:uncharacterized protein (TIGR03382 family)
MRCKPLILRIAAAVLTVLPSVAVAQVFLIDFGGANITSTGVAPNDPVSTWNNPPTSVTQTDTGLHSGLVTVDNTPSSIGIQMTRRFNGVNENGTLASTQFAGNATRDSLFGNTGEFSGLSNIFPQFKLTNLDTASVYSLTFYASRTGVGDNRETQYDVAGATSMTTFLNAANNVDVVTTATGIAPDGSNEITISLSPGPNNNNGATLFTYLGVLRIEAQPIPEPATAAMALAGLLILARRRR